MADHRAHEVVSIYANMKTTCDCLSFSFVNLVPIYARQSKYTYMRRYSLWDSDNVLMLLMDSIQNFVHTLLYSILNK